MNMLMNSFRAFAVLTLLLTAPLSFGQIRRTLPVPEGGYWVVETAPRPNRQSVAYFYNTDNVLVYKEQLKKVRVNIRRIQVAESLNTVLTQALREYAATRQMRADQNWVAAQIR